jgi:hypothetical protein
MMNDFDDRYERPNGGEGLRLRNTAGDKASGPRDGIAAGLLVALFVAILIAWSTAKGDGVDTTVQCIAPQMNCG